MMNGQLNLEELSRPGAQRMLAIALEAEIAGFIEQHPASAYSNA